MALVHNPSTTTSGLVFCLDAVNPLSYPRSGTTWTDLTRSSFNGTLLNGPAFSNDGGGSLTFDGTDDRVDCGTNFSSIITGTNSFTIETWVYPENVQNQYNNIWGNHADNFTGLVCQQNATNLNQYSWGWGTGGSWGPGSNLFNINTQRWNHLVAMRNGSNVQTYLNGILIDTTVSSANLGPSVYNFQIANGYNPSNPRLFRGKIGGLKIYSKGLSNIEVLQNFNATRNRFGV